MMYNVVARHNNVYCVCLCDSGFKNRMHCYLPIHRPTFLVSCVSSWSDISGPGPWRVFVAAREPAPCLPCTEGVYCKWDRKQWKIPIIPEHYSAVLAHSSSTHSTDVFSGLGIWYAFLRPSLTNTTHAQNCRHTQHKAQRQRHTQLHTLAHSLYVESKGLRRTFIDKDHGQLSKSGVTGRVSDLPTGF